MVMDVSGSMQQPVPGSGDSRLELAKKAALQAVGQLAADDQLGLWAFSTEPPGTSEPPYQVLVRPGPVSQVKAAFTDGVRGLAPGRGTALYATIRAAVQNVHRTYHSDKINAVVLLTDGKNEYDKDNNLNSLLDSLDTEDPDATVRVFPIAYGEQADLSVLQQIGKAARATAYDATKPASIEQVMTGVLSNF
jgi:Ca-activated chloride channel family protein